jgi:hypothetical protein
MPVPGAQAPSAGTGLSRESLVSFGEDARQNVYVVAGDSVARIVR